MEAVNGKEVVKNYVRVYYSSSREVCALTCINIMSVTTAKQVDFPLCISSLGKKDEERFMTRPTVRRCSRSIECSV